MDKLPIKLIKAIKENRDLNYNPIYNPSIPIKEQKIKRETLSMIAVLDLNYWCENEEEKIKLKKQFNENELKYQKQLKEKYNVENLFKSKQKEEIIDNVQNLPIEIKKNKGIFVRVLERIKNIFHIA